MTRMAVELEIMRMLNQGIGGASILANDSAQRQRIEDLEQQNAALREALEGMLFIFGHNEGYVQVKNAKQALKEHS